MHTEKLHDVAFDIQQELNALQVPEKFQKVEDRLQQIVTHTGGAEEKNVPDRSNLESSFENALQELFEALDRSASNEFFPSQIAVLRRIDGWRLTGARLRTEIENVLRSGPTEQEETLDRLQSLRGEFNYFYQRTKRLCNALEALNVDRESLPADLAEFGALYPLAMEEVDLDEVRSELKDLDRYLRVFPIITGDSPRLSVRSVSSDSIWVFIGLGLHAGWVLSGVVQRITGIVKDVYEIRQMHRRMEEDHGYPESLTEDQVNEIVESRLGELHEGLIQEYGIENGQTSNHLRKALYYLADAVDEGAELEVKIYAPTTEEGEEREELDVPGFTSFKDFKERGSSMAELDRPDERILFGEPPALLEEGQDQGQEQNGKEDGNGDGVVNENDGETGDGQDNVPKGETTEEGANQDEDGGA